MKIKTKLVLGVGLLFAMIVLLVVVSSVYINMLSSDTKNILIANYNSIDYSRQMLNALTNGMENRDAQDLFRENLEKQKKNNTEVGEKEMTDKIESDFHRVIAEPNDIALNKLIQKDITDVAQYAGNSIEK